jgi:hypothetical protein
MLVRDYRLTANVGRDWIATPVPVSCPTLVKTIRRSKREGMIEGYLLLCLILARTSNRSESVSRHPAGFDGCCNHRYTDAFDRGQSIGPKTVRHLFIETAYC